MKRTALIASFALAAGFAAPAMANTIAGVTVSDEDWPYVVEYCEELYDHTVGEAADVDPSSTARLSVTSIELESIQQADCEAAGIYGEQEGLIDEEELGEILN